LQFLILFAAGEEPSSNYFFLPEMTGTIAVPNITNGEEFLFQQFLLLHEWVKELNLTISSLHEWVE
jgi:hypothetical protein